MSAATTSNAGELRLQQTGKYKQCSYRPRDKNKEETNEYNICYICGCNGGNWSLYTKGNDIDKSPYFPFLELIEKAEGAKDLKENGRIDACTVCFSFLIQQWHSYEEIGTPIEKRNYWLKTTNGGAINNSTTGTIDFYRDGDVRECASTSSNSRVSTEPNYCKERCEDIDPTSKQCIEKPGEEAMCEDQSDMIIPLENIEKQENNKNEETSQIENGENRNETCQFCFACGTKQNKSFMKTVHTKPQLRKETPFYPVLATLCHKPREGNKVGFTGKVTVCEDCEKSLHQQWQVFQEKGIHLSERHYQLARNTSKDSCKDRIFAACFICEGEYLEERMWNLNTKQNRPGESYFPFLTSLAPFENEIRIDGQVRACTACHHSLIHQWKTFELQGVHEYDRKYQYSTKPSKVPINSSGLNGVKKNCKICSKLYPVSKMEYSENEQALVCHLCKNMLTENVCHNLEETTNRFLKQDNTSTHKKNPSECQPTANVAGNNMDICFLCGDKIQESNAKELSVVPQQCTSGNYIPFFPSLAYRVPAYQAKPPTNRGTVTVCFYCHGNMMNQWYKFQGSNQIMSNPWARNYILGQYMCYLCENVYPRLKVTLVSTNVYPFIKNIKKTHEDSKNQYQNYEYVVCHSCKEMVQSHKENFSTRKHNMDFDVTHDDNLYASSITSKYRQECVADQLSSSGRNTVVLVGDSESEGEGLSKTEALGISHDHQSQHFSNKHTGGPQLQAKTTIHSTPMSSPSTTAAQNSSFAAALRKLAKQAMSPGSTATVPPVSNNQVLSPVKQKGTESPKLNGTTSGFKKEVSEANLLNTKENRVQASVESTSDVIPTSISHQVLPGVFARGPRGLDSKSNSHEEHHGASARLQGGDIPRLRAVHPTQPPFYMTPFLQRPPINDSVYIAPFHYYPTPIVDSPGMIPPGFDHETWRKRRAMEHLRQQHERHFFVPPHERPLYIMEQEHLKPLSGQGPLPAHRPYHPDLPQVRDSLSKNLSRADTNADSRTGPHSSLTRETEINSEIASSRIQSSRREHSPVRSSVSPRSSSSENVQTSVAPAPTAATMKDFEKEGENEGSKDVKQREHQIMWTRKMFEQKRRIRQEEIEWQHRQQQMRQQKREVQQELYQFRQKLLQQKESELEDSSSKKEHQKAGKEKNTSSPSQEKLEGDMETISVDQIVYNGPYGYPLPCPDPPSGIHAVHMAPPPRTMFPSPGFQPHEMFPHPSAFLQQQPPRMDTRMYREYLSQSSHFFDNKSVSDWLEKQKRPDTELPIEGHIKESHNASRQPSVGLAFHGRLGTSRDKYHHEPLKLKFMKDLGLMTVSQNNVAEQSHETFIGAKRKLDDDIPEDDSNKENRFENGETDSPKSAKDVEQDKDGESYCKKVDFLYNLGLVTHRKRQELEDDFEKNRWERRVQRFHRRTKRTKKQKKEEKERSRTPLDVSGPMTRQKQQLLQEYGLLLPLKDSQEKDSSSDATSDGKEKDEKEVDKDDTSNHTDKMLDKNSGHIPPKSGTKTPQLTLQSITHMENPYGIPSAFRPTYYGSGLSSGNPNKNNHPGVFLHKDLPLVTSNSTEFTSTPSNVHQSQAVVLAPSEAPQISNYNTPTSHWTASNDDLPKWRGTTTVVRSYLEYHKDQECELSALKKRSERLKRKNVALNQERERVSSTYSDLSLSQRKLHDEQRVLNGKLDKMHNFLVFVQNT